MFKLFDTKQQMNGEDISRKYPSKGSILINPKERISDKGVILPYSGELYAICDREGLDRMVDEANKLRKQGIPLLLDTVSLEDNDEHQ